MLGIVAAFKEEAIDYLGRGRFRPVERSGPYRFYRARRGPSAVLALGAVGKRGATEATRKLVEDYGPRLVVSAGFAGSVRRDLSTGDAFLCDRVFSLEGPPAFWTADNASELPLLRAPNGNGNGANGHANGHGNGANGHDANGHGSNGDGGNGHARPMGCVSVSQFVQGASMKAWLGRVLPVSVIDMESYWVSDVAASYGLPHVVVRAVLDGPEDPMPEFLVDAMRSGGSPRLRAMRYAVAHPHRLRWMLRLAAQTKLARRSLSDCLEAHLWN